MSRIRCWVLLLPMFVAFAPRAFGQFGWAECPDWTIILDDYGYSDLALDERPGFEGREYLSGEWAAAVAYTLDAQQHGPLWLPPKFTFPDWDSNSDLGVETMSDMFDRTNSYGLPIGSSVITNQELLITLVAEMIDTTNGVAQPWAPRSAPTSSNGISDRYVFRHTFKVQNNSGRTLTSVKFFMFLHALQAMRAVYDDRAYTPSWDNYRFAITERGTDMGTVGFSSIGAAHEDTVSLHANIQPAAWEVGHYGKESTDSHASGKPSVGVHLSVEADSLSNLDYFAPTEQWVSGAMRFDLGTLPPNATTNLEFLLAIHSDTVVQRTRVVAWGSDSSGQTQVPLGLTNATTVAAGGAHSLALCADGRVVAWGDNSYNQATVPADLPKVIAIAAGDTHSLGLLEDETVVAWGDNRYGQCRVPADLSPVRAIAAGGKHSLALLWDGSVVGWGDNSFGQSVGPGGNFFEDIAAGGNHTIAVNNQTSSVFAWGDGSKGQLNVPPELFSPYRIAAGNNHNVAVGIGSAVMSWGDNTFGQLNIPSGLEFVDLLAAGGDHNLALDYDGRLYAWGRNSAGQLNVPPGLTRVLAIAAGGDHSLAVALVPPALRLFVDGDSAVVAWPIVWQDPVELQKASSPDSSLWEKVSTVPVIDGIEYRVRIPLTPGPQLFRLKLL